MTDAALNDAALNDAAFGADPGRWPLPTAHSSEQLWLRAVAAGGQGRYGAARTDLAELLRHAPTARWVSLALSTQASFLRQQGWHRRAAGLDGRANAVAGGDADGDSEAGVDALAGLAADALGVGRLAAAAVLLDRAVGRHGRADDPPPRLAVRLAWVRAELAMAGADGRLACSAASEAVELAGAAAPALHRHRIKSEVVLAAALCCAGDLPASRRVADAALDDTETARLVPLRWALACLLGGIGSAGHSPAEVAAIRDRSAMFVTRHGGRWNDR